MKKYQSGFTLIEALVGLVLFAMIGGALLQGLSTGYRSLAISQEHTQAAALATSQIESIKSERFSRFGDYVVIDVPDGYAIDISVDDAHICRDCQSVTGGPPRACPCGGVYVRQGAGVSGFMLQYIEVCIRHGGKSVIIITSLRTGLAFE